MTTSLKLFGDEIQKYCRLSGKSQKLLARELGLHPTVLSHKLSSGNNLSSNSSRVLTFTETRAIIKVLAEWEAITTAAEVQKLLALVGCPTFSTEEWRTPPLNNLEAGTPIAVTATADQAPIEIYIPEVEKSATVHVLSAPTIIQSTISMQAEALPKTNLLPQLTNFIGREQELLEIKELLTKPKLANAPVRLLTLSGVGGVGKTRLAIELGTALLPSYPDGVWIAELGTINDPDLLLQSVAEVLGVIGQFNSQPVLSTLTHHLRNKQLLLIMDNCEHLAEACAHLVQNLLACPKLQIIITSREPLALPGEVVFQLSSLSLPDSSNQAAFTTDELYNYEATHLFIDRAIAVNPKFNLSPKIAVDLTELCRRLDGIPLAIELAAARIKMLSVEQINERLNNRFQLLTGGSRTALPHQKTLRALVDWSYDLLSDSEKELFGYLAVFAGGFSLEAVEAIWNKAEATQEDALDLLGMLVNKSLVAVVDDGNENGKIRYRYLETIKEYAQEKLVENGKIEIVRQKHCRYFLELAETTFVDTPGAQHANWFPTVEAEHDNFRAALRWAQETDKTNLLIRLSGALGRFWYVGCFFGEGWRWLEISLGLLKTTTNINEKTRASLLYWAATLAMSLGKYDRATDLYKQTLDLARELGDSGSVTAVLNRLGELSRNRGEYAQARTYLEESLVLAHKLGYIEVVANALCNSGEVNWDQGKYDEAEKSYEESLKIFRQLQDQIGIAKMLLRLAQIKRVQGNYSASLSLLEQSQTIFQQQHNQWGVASTMHRQGQVALAEKDFDAAKNLFEKSFALFQQQGDRWGIAEQLADLGRVAMYQGQLEQAQKFLEESSTLYREIGICCQIAALQLAQGELAYRRGNYIEAELLLAQGLELQRTLGIETTPETILLEKTARNELRA